MRQAFWRIQQPQLLKTCFYATNSPNNTPDRETDSMIEFSNGIPIAVSNLNEEITIHGSAVALFSYLNTLGSQHGIGRVDLVENRFVGMKSKGVYETPGGTILWKAHQDLESLVLDREVLLFKHMWAPKIAQLIYNGFWLVLKWIF